MGRFAPSPTGRMHAGNIFSALIAWLVAKSQSGRIVLRIEDLDTQRSKPSYIDSLMKDFENLGLFWDKGPYYQSAPSAQSRYADAFDTLACKGLLYPCFCSRSDLLAASAPHFGEKQVYPGTCKHLSSLEIAQKSQQKAPAWRVVVPDANYELDDLVQGRYVQNLARECGDYIVRRSDGAFAYQLACVVDDMEQGVNSVVRGMDLLCSAPQQIYLQELLSGTGCQSVVQYAHIPLFVSSHNKRLSKRNHDASLDYMLSEYGSYPAVLGHIAFVGGLQPTDEPTTPEALLKTFSVDSFAANLPDREQIVWHA